VMGLLSEERQLRCGMRSFMPHTVMTTSLLHAVVGSSLAVVKSAGEGTIKDFANQIHRSSEDSNPR